MNDQLQTASLAEPERVTSTIETSHDRICTAQPSQLHRFPSPQPELISVAPAPTFDKNLDLIFATVELAELKAAKNWLDVRHHQTRQERHKPYYSTQLVNTCAEPIRIERFSTYIRRGKTLVLHSLTGGYFSSQQFQEWYDLDRSGWLAPGQVVTDPNNHSHPNVYWVYFGTTASGREVIAGALWQGDKAWWQVWG